MTKTTTGNNKVTKTGTGSSNSTKVNTKLTANNLATTKTPKLPDNVQKQLKDATPQQTAAINKLQQKAKDERQHALKPSIPTNTGKSLATTTKPAKIAVDPTKVKNDGKTLQNAVTDPKAKAAAAALASGKGKVTSKDLKALQNSSGASTDPKVAGATHRLTASTPAGLSLTDNNVKGLQSAEKDNKHFSQADQQLIHQALLGNPPLSKGQAAQLAALQDRPGISGQEKVALAQAGLAAQQEINQNSFNNQLLQGLGGLGGGLLNAGVLNGGFNPGGGGFFPGGGGFIPGGDGGFPPGMPVVWVPSDSSSVLGDDGIPSGSGIELAVLPGGATAGFDDGEVQDSADQTENLGDLTQAAEVAQQTRYLRVANETDKPITVFVQYQTLNDKNEWVWSAEGDDALPYQLQPGEVTDLADNGWRINAVSAHVWAKSDAGDEWVAFKNQELWLVPEQDADGNHVYQDPDVQVFDFTVR